jgi:hypothetical protein
MSQQKMRKVIHRERELVAVHAFATLAARGRRVVDQEIDAAVIRAHPIGELANLGERAEIGALEHRGSFARIANRLHDLGAALVVAAVNNHGCAERR